MEENGIKVVIADNSIQDREGKEKIPAKVIAMTSNRLELPSRSEGFDELYFVGNDGQNMTISEWRETDEL